MGPQSTTNKILIIGGVALGAGVAAKVRRMSEQAEIVMIEKGPYVSFANCGLPYYLGGVIKDRNRLLLHTPKSLKDRFNIDVRTRHEALSIDRQKKTVTILDIETNKEYEESYDKLVLAMGAKPISPNIPGKDLNGIFHVRSVPDVDEIKEWIENARVNHVGVIGGGFIGIEVVENLVALGIRVTLIEKAPQILPPFDKEMTSPVLHELERLGVRVLLNDGIVEFTGEDKVKAVKLESGETVKADMFVMNLGVRPDNGIAKAAGLSLGVAGALQVNESLQTSDPDIYGGGDLAEIRHRVDGKKRWIALAGAPNKQGRVIAENLFGKNISFTLVQGTSIVRFGKVVIAMTGLSEKELKKTDIEFFVSYNTAGHHAGYYPGAEDMTIKLMVEKSSGKLLGAEIVGGEGVDKRIDVLASSIAANMTVEDLTNLDLAYAPPFSSAKDPVIMAGMAADNIYSGRVKAVYHKDELGSKNVRLLDVRRDDEVEKGMLPGALHIPLDELRDRAKELNPDMHWVVYCRSGQRSYFATCILKGLEFEHVYNLNGGYIVQQLKEEVN